MAWTLTTPAGNIQSMPTELEPDSESLTFRCTPSDKKALEVLMAEHFPTIKNKSLVLRAIFRLGMPILAGDSGLVTRAETPKPNELTAAYQREKADAEATKTSEQIKREMAEWVKTGRKGPPPDKPTKR